MRNLADSREVLAECVFTNLLWERLSVVAQWNGLVDAIQVDIMVYSVEEGMAKPDPHIYQSTCDHLNVLPEEALFLDNSTSCVQAAQDLGMYAILFENSVQAIADVQECLDAHS